MERPYTDSSELERRSRIINIVTRALLTFEPYHTKLQNDFYSPVRIESACALSLGHASLYAKIFFEPLLFHPSLS